MVLTVAESGAWNWYKSAEFVSFHDKVKVYVSLELHIYVLLTMIWSYGLMTKDDWNAPERSVAETNIHRSMLRCTFWDDELKMMKNKTLYLMSLGIWTLDNR